MAASLTLSRLLLSSPTHLCLSTTTSFLFPTTKTLSLKFSFPLKLRHPKPLKLSTTATTKPTISATIKVRDKLPEATPPTSTPPASSKPATTISDLTKSKNAILFAVPGAFTPTYSQKRLPGFVEKSKELKAKGVDTIACISVNDAFVMRAWKKNLKINNEVLLLFDGNSDVTRAIGVELDLSDKPVGLGVRSMRYAL